MIAPKQHKRAFLGKSRITWEGWALRDKWVSLSKKGGKGTEGREGTESKGACSIWDRDAQMLWEAV